MTAKIGWPWNSTLGFGKQRLVMHALELVSLAPGISSGGEHPDDTRIGFHGRREVDAGDVGMGAVG